MRQRRKVGSENPETLMAEEEEIEEGRFFACYLLTSRNPRFKGHTYIGFTVNPRRRIRQHNGEISQGAWRTKRKRPWEMVMCIYGFPTNVSALQFEWAWQNPTVSKAVRQAAASFKSLGGLASKIKLAYTMLTLPPWQSLNITVNFFSTQYTKHSAGCPRLPGQMKVKFCPMDDLPSTIISDDLSENEDESSNECQGDMNTSTLQEESLPESIVQNSTDHQQNDAGNRIYEVYGCGKEVGEESEDECYNEGEFEETLSEFIARISAYEQQVGETEKRIQDNVYKCNQEVGDGCKEKSPVGSTPSSNVTNDDDIGLRGSVDDGNTIELSRHESEQLTTVVQDDDELCSKSYLRPCGGGEVIDLTTPSPVCRNGLCGKKSRVTTACPQIIDLTKSPNFIQL